MTERAKCHPVVAWGLPQRDKEKALRAMRYQEMRRGIEEREAARQQRRQDMQALYDTGKTLEEVAAQFGVTRSRVQQVVDTEPRKLADAARRKIEEHLKRVALEERYARTQAHGTINRYHRGCRCDLCRKANAAYYHKHYWDHHEKRLAYAKAYNKAHPEVQREANRRYYEKHREELLAKYRAHYHAHREEQLVRMRARYQAHREEYRAYYKARYAAKKAKR